MKTALYLITFEIASTQPLYVRAVSRYIQRCLEKNAAERKDDIASLHRRKTNFPHAKIEVTIEAHEEDIKEWKGVKDSSFAIDKEHFREERAVEESKEGEGLLEEDVPRGCGCSSVSLTGEASHTPSRTDHSLPSIQFNPQSQSQIFSPTDNHNTSVMTVQQQEQEQVAIEEQTEAELLEDFLSVLADQKFQNMQNGRRDRCVDRRSMEGDVRIVTESWPTGLASDTVPLAVLGTGSVYCSPDFVTASIEMNRALFNRHLAQEEKRKVLFGSDQIIP